MERVSFTNSNNLTIVGNLYPSASDSIIILCHGFLPNKNSREMFDGLIKTFISSGFSALAFDFRGCGESDDDSLTVAKEVDDLRSAIAFVKLKGYKRIALYGYSLGTVICLKCCTSEIITMVLTAALTDSMHYNWDEAFTKEQMQEIKEKGHITEHRSEEIREKIIIDKQMLIDFELINQKELLKNITCPVLLIHGNKGEEENLLCERSKRAIDLLSNDSKLEIIDGANHSFIGYFNTLIDLANDWFIKQF